MSAPIRALLGPTNTGKTHRALERMLEHDSGMIGLPLRLLAREVYDRVSARVGEERVALVTGEERRVPRRPAYWVSTVEAMPVDLDVDFVAVDEVQLAATAERGHVFTDRLLRARGVRETWFLGAGSMQDAVREVVPTAEMAAHPRLSKLAFTGASALSQLPPRSAVIAFGLPQVLELAEKLKTLRGGAAVVLGALSPRARNAQVALFESGDVDYLVATDAIGMGLNLHVGHVAFSALRKFDGGRARGLEPAEIAQIAGRAGRYLTDGTFGTVSPISIAPDVAGAIEAHAFAPVRRLFWRSADLDFTSVDELLASLRARPRGARLWLGDDADDVRTLAALADDAEVRRLARGPEATELLWAVASIPDFRRQLLGSHVALLREIFVRLASASARLDDGFLADRIAAIDVLDGDLDTLTDRLAAIRTWTYVSQREAWLEHAERWQEATRALEDRLSDALHERIVQRFVDRRGKRRTPAGKRPRVATPAAIDETHARASHHPFAALAVLRAKSFVEPVDAPIVDAAEALVDANHRQFSLEPSGVIAFGGRAVAKLVRGERLTTPEVRLVGFDDDDGATRLRATRRLTAAARDFVGEITGALATDAHDSAAVRGLSYALAERLGTERTASVASLLAALDDRDRAVLAARSIVIGGAVVFARTAATTRALEIRSALVRTYFDDVPAATTRGVVSMARGTAPENACLAAGWVPLGAKLVRADAVVRVEEACAEPAPDEHRIASIVGCRLREVPAIVAALSDAK